ncbi:MOSC domain-containing protein [Actinosynnema sp. CS-041913]|uniref:MOSC domain-containing protein n=1 Tax=Actinosynnema sp. CS-041913 TaxID=3239917 RepID=UPI003D8E5726
MPHVLSVNLGTRTDFDHAALGHTGIGKRPVTGPIEVRAPRQDGSGLIGDHISDSRNHGGPDQAVYAYAREDLDDWAAELGRDLAPGLFGENLTTAGMDLSNARIGERWRIGTALVQVTNPRIPCRTFAGVMEERGWMKTFTRKAVPGAYFRVLESGTITAGDEATLVERPDHDVTIQLAFKALTLEPELLPRLLNAGDLLTDVVRSRVERRLTPDPA